MRLYQISLSILSICFIVSPTHAASNPTFTGLLNQYPAEFYALLILCILELVIIWILSKTLLKSMGYTEPVSAAKVKDFQKKNLFQRTVDSFMSNAGDEVDLKHDYDGISELDNKAPQWWTVAFYLTILFGVVYLYRMYISESMPNQITELNAEIAMAKKEKSSQLATMNEEVDENSVIKLDEQNIMKGGMIYSANCIACHGPHGEGNVVGPNLTDDYWIHKGSIKDIFTSIKYGFVDKGMKSWQNDFSPFQIAQLASFVHSLHGTNPANAKAKQGELYKEGKDGPKDTLSFHK